MAATRHLFISDLHLLESRPETTAALMRFLSGPAQTAANLWVLGDLFEYWVGDDDLADPYNAGIADAFARLSRQGVQLRFIVGNRDFLMGNNFAERCGGQLLAEPQLVDLGGTPTVLVHGDAQCTDDTAYQQFRSMSRNPAWQAQFLSQPREVRHQMAAALRARSEASKQAMASADAYEIMDVNAEAIRATLKETGAQWMIHGHTHRPATHHIDVDGKACERWVLADWHDHSEWLEWDGAQLTRHRD